MTEISEPLAAFGEQADWYASDYYKSSPTSDPSGPSSGPFRVIRGGSWYSRAAGCRSANRIRFSPDSRDFDLGFRLVRTAN
ncbi:MAG: SUMF1/EgtB/PvdO family nonheme iron enzyme [Gemmatimonadota bacterium]|nr:SUMF1/EgtB/PvdO family nonheme iron enzyme [Gemmatimonadota bacterium]